MKKYIYKYTRRVFSSISKKGTVFAGIQFSYYASSYTRTSVDITIVLQDIKI